MIKTNKNIKYEKNLYWGISAFSHDAAICVMYKNDILFASHTERWSKIKNDKNIPENLIEYLLKKYGFPEKTFFYEKPFLKLSRQLFAGQGFSKFFQTRNSIKNTLKHHNIVYVDHHRSHAAAGYFTNCFNNNRAVILVMDAIGEWTTISIWHGQNNQLKCLFKQFYPNSIGLWYSAFTQAVGLKPNEEEYIFMGMSALGNQYKFYNHIVQNCFENTTQNKKIILKKNFHIGSKAIDFLPYNIDMHMNFDIAASCQKIYEQLLMHYVRIAKEITNEKNLILMGGCALNCVANSAIMKSKLFDNIWIMPSPGDAGNCLGAITAYNNQKIIWHDADLGFEIEGSYPIYNCLNDLLYNQITAVANGRAEFGPRALGNRSILADPRKTNIKDIVNKIKQREPFRPFAPVVLAEHAHEYFELDPDYCLNHYKYMQFVVKCKFPHLFPGIVHVDNTSRLQVVTKDSRLGIRKLLEAWYQKTGCPILLNTSLNIKGQPLINDVEDSKLFYQKHKLIVHTQEC